MENVRICTFQPYYSCYVVWSLYKSQKALRNWENFNILGSGAFLYLAASRSYRGSHVFTTRVMHLPTHPPLGLAFAMCKHGVQNSSTMSGFGRNLLKFLLTFPDNDTCGGRLVGPQRLHSWSKVFRFGRHHLQHSPANLKAMPAEEATSWKNTSISSCWKLKSALADTKFGLYNNSSEQQKNEILPWV